MTKGTVRRIEKGVEMLTYFGLAAVTGGIADAVADGTRIALDMYSVGAGVVLLVLALWLTGKVNGDSV